VSLSAIGALIAESHHRPSRWFVLALVVVYPLLLAAFNVFLVRRVGGAAWRRWWEHARHLSLAQRWAIWLALSRRKRIGDDRLRPAMLARIELARALLQYTKRRAFVVVRWVLGLLALSFIPVTLLGEHHQGEPAWVRWYLVATSLAFGIGLIAGYPRFVSWNERRMDQAERANQVGGEAEPDS
jgi:hypothetical protein